MTLTLSDEQLAEVKRGGTISVRSPDDEQQLLICAQSEFSAVILAVVQDIRSRLGDKLSEEELKEEIEDVLIRKAWAEAGRKAANAWAKDNPY
ncbi:MAG: hypothetical protein H0T47_06785 [Planctomycetaceae bacterium]|nr:hypothetical protein [Planctomycetaceae bacterium]